MHVEITQDILERIHTDSDVYDVAKELSISPRKLEYLISNKRAEGTTCHNCENLNKNWICMNCSRGKEDLYKDIEGV